MNMNMNNINQPLVIKGWFKTALFTLIGVFIYFQFHDLITIEKGGIGYQMNYIFITASIIFVVSATVYLLLIKEMNSHFIKRIIESIFDILALIFLFVLGYNTLLAIVLFLIIGFITLPITYHLQNYLYKNKL